MSNSDSPRVVHILVRCLAAFYKKKKVRLRLIDGSGIRISGIAVRFLFLSNLGNYFCKLC